LDKVCMSIRWDDAGMVIDHNNKGTWKHHKI